MMLIVSLLLIVPKLAFGVVFGVLKLLLKVCWAVTGGACRVVAGGLSGGSGGSGGSGDSRSD